MDTPIRDRLQGKEQGDATLGQEDITIQVKSHPHIQESHPFVKKHVSTIATVRLV
ncbi:hypothetical protein Hanom_Chr10g00960651 [Helianthus anomalus]